MTMAQEAVAPPLKLPLLVILTAALAAAALEVKIDGGGLCHPGLLPPSCQQGELAAVNWPGYLQLLCRSEVERNEVAAAVTRVLAKFSKDTADDCRSGFITTVMALKGSGAGEWEDQVVRFLPDGNVRFLINAFDDDEDSTRFKQFSATMPPVYSLAPPFPLWPFPGILGPLREAQDLASMVELPRTERCSEVRLAEVGCGNDPAWAELLRVLCSRCQTPRGEHGLPCLYDQTLLGLVRSVLTASRDRSRKIPCPHGFVAAILSLSGRTDLSLPDVSPAVFRTWRQDGSEAYVLHCAFRQVAQDPRNYISLNIPMLDLAPYPFHSGMLRSARINAPKDADYYRAFLGLVSTALSRAGVAHVLLPGDLSVGHWTLDELQPRGSLYSFFVSYAARPQLEELLAGLLDELHTAFAGAWRLAKPMPGGLWQVGEEPFRFAPEESLAYRVFCSQCLYASFYFYLREGLGPLLPLAPWTPCLIPSHRVFPARTRDLGDSLSAPFAFDIAWLHRSQRPPVVWTPEGPSGLGVRGESCRSARDRLLQKEFHRQERTSSSDTLLLPSWPAPLTPEFDLSSGVHPEMGLYDLMRLREDSEAAGLHRYSDKVRFKTRLLQEGVPVPKILYMSNESPQIGHVLQNLGTTRFVAKPTHLAATSFVYVMRDGVNLVNGQTTSLAEVEAGLAEAWHDRHVDDWATESTTPGVIVEELVEPPARDGQPGSTPDELKCQTFFGEMLYCEWVFVRNMTTGEDGSEHFMGAHLAGDRAQPSMGHKACGIPNFESKGYIFKDRSCFGCAEQVPLSTDAWQRLVEIVEKVAVGTDHIRIDIFVTPSGEPVVNEANISFLKISKLPSVLVEEMRRRWLEGYRAFYS